MGDLLHKNLIYTWLTVLSVISAISVCKEQKVGVKDTCNFGEINVHRINVIEPDGKPRVIISNRPKFPGVFVGGKEYRHAGRESGKAPTGGFLFFNDDGDEVGGMLFRSSKKGGKHHVASFLGLDQNQQDQIMALEYNETDGKRNAGLQVWDQPDEPLLPIVELGDKAMRADTASQRDALIEKQNELAKERSGAWAERFYAGKQLEEAIVKLSDKSGKPRLVLRVSAKGESSIDFLDATGKVTKSIRQ